MKSNISFKLFSTCEIHFQSLDGLACRPSNANQLVHDHESSLDGLPCTFLRFRPQLLLLISYNLFY